MRIQLRLYGIATREITFARRLIDVGIDIVHGHSSHHPRPVEIYRSKPIRYGCGDVIDDYEGICGHQPFRGDLRLLYLVSTDSVSGERVSLQMVPVRVGACGSSGPRGPPPVPDAICPQPSG